MEWTPPDGIDEPNDSNMAAQQSRAAGLGLEKVER
jgi:hypothetical protein